MKSIILIILFLTYSFLTYKKLKSFYNKLYISNKIFFWIISIIINLLLPYTLLLFISIKINNYFLITLHSGTTILLISLLTSAYINYNLNNKNKYEKQ